MSKSKPESLLGLSANDAKLILLANFLAGEQKVDYENLAQLGGYKSAASAAVMYRNAKRKLSEYDPGKAGTTSTPDGTPVHTPKKTPTKRKTATVSSAPNTPHGEGGADGEETSPTKQKRQRKTAVKEAAAQEASDDSKMEDELFPGIKAEIEDES